MKPHVAWIQRHYAPIRKARVRVMRHGHSRLEECNWPHSFRREEESSRAREPLPKIARSDQPVVGRRQSGVPRSPSEPSWHIAQGEHSTTIGFSSEAYAVPLDAFNDHDSGRNPVAAMAVPDITASPHKQLPLDS